MKTLIFNGSPRPEGDTVQLIRRLKDQLAGTVEVISCYDESIRACIDCRYCWKNPGCAVKDGMQAVYAQVATADNIIIASPLHFSELSGPLLCVTSRFQTYYSAMYIRKEQPFIKTKKGGVILVGGGNGTLQTPYRTARHIFHHLNVSGEVPLVASFDTNNVSAIDDAAALHDLAQMAAYFNGQDAAGRSPNFSG